MIRPDSPTSPSGLRVQFVATLDRVSFSVPKGSTGVVVEESRSFVAILMDETIPGCEEWGNTVNFILPEDADDLAAFAPSPAAETSR